MPNWTSEPNRGEQEQTMPIVRTPSRGNVAAIITCKNVVGCNTHWYGGRTVPCEIPMCDACAEGVAWRWHGYVSAVDLKTDSHFLFEFTAAAHDAFALYLTRHPELRGCHFKTSRMGGRANGRVQIRTKLHELPIENLVEPPDIMMILCRIWNVEPERQIPSLYSSDHNGDQIRKTTQIKSR